MHRCVIAFIGAVSTMALIPIASAADLPGSAPIYPTVAPPLNWTGFYIGGNIGYGWGNIESTATVPFLASAGLPTTYTDSLKPQGIIGGGQYGFNWQADPNWVLGIEGDIQASGQRASSTFVEPFTIPGVATGTATVSHSEQLQWFGTVRGRIGYAFYHAMLYGTGGLAYGQLNSSLTGTIISNLGTASGTLSDSKINVGWTVGGGFEGGVPNCPNWTWRVEYLYIDLGTINYTFNDPVAGTAQFSNKITDNIVRVGINYLFN
jgi:outer membrane immunogenic protein